MLNSIDVLDGVPPARIAELHRHIQRYRQLATPLMDFIPAVTSHFVAPRHLAPLVDVIERAEREPVRALVSCAPRHAKTESLLHGIAWRLARRPSTAIGYASYSAGLARSKSREARDYAIAAGVRIRDDANGLSEWRTNQNGGLLAAGVEGAWTGHGVDLLIVDDPHKDREQAESRTYRDAVYDWLVSTAMSRIEPGGSVIINMQRWHQDDLIGRLAREQPGTWEIINLPALSLDGVPLWPERWPVEALEELRLTLGEYNWASQYLGEPRVRGSQVFRDPVRYIHPEIAGRRIIIGVDVAATVSTRADYSVAAVLAIKGGRADMTADVLEVFRAQVEIPRLCIELERLQKKYAGAPLIVESAGVGVAVPQLLKQLGGRLRVVPFTPKGDKFLRAQSVAAGWNAGRVRVPSTDSEWIRPFLGEVLNFTGVRDDHDDQVDAIAHAWNYALATAPVKPVQIERGPFAKRTNTTPTDDFGRPLGSHQ